MRLMALSESQKGKPCTIGVAGTGFLGRGLISLLHQSPDFEVGPVLTRRPLDQVPEIDSDLLTHSREELVEQSDIVVECSGDVYHAAETVQLAFEAEKPVVTMNSEFHVTAGSYFCTSGVLTEAEGDQPGSLAALHEEVLSMGFEPLVFGNMKGYLNHHPTREDMEFWSKKNGISLAKVTCFTDGTKLQVEQALVANGLGAGILRQGLLGPVGLTLQEVADTLGPRAVAAGGPVVDYVLNSELPPGVFIVARHPVADPEVLRYLKMGDGPYYALLRPYHLCQFEMLRTLTRIAEGGRVLLNNSPEPEIQVVAVAKERLEPGHEIRRAIGGFDVRGEAARFERRPNAVPIGLLDGALVSRRIEPGHVLDWDDVEVREGLARDAARAIAERVLSAISGEDEEAESVESSSTQLS